MDTMDYVFRAWQTTVIVSTLLFFTSPLWGDVGLQGGEFEVWKDGSVLSEFTTLDTAIWAASVLEADTVTMRTIRADRSDVAFEVWRDGAVVDTFPTKAEAESFAAENGGDSITMPPQTVIHTEE